MDVCRRVTKLVRQKRRKDRVSVFLDGEFAFGVDELTAAALSIGQSLTDEDIARLRSRSEVNEAQERALRLLERRPRSRTELARRLRQAGIAEEVYEEALERLEQVGLVDDEEFARYWVEQRMSFRPRSKRAIGYELRQRGVQNNVIDRVLGELDEMDAALALLERYRKRLEGIEDEEEREAKAVALLQRRGFSYYVARKALKNSPAGKNRAE